MKRPEVRKAVRDANRSLRKLPTAERRRCMKPTVNVIAKGASSLGGSIGTAADFFSIFPALRADQMIKE